MITRVLVVILPVPGIQRHIGFEVGPVPARGTTGLFDQRCQPFGVVRIPPNVQLVHLQRLLQVLDLDSGGLISETFDGKRYVYVGFSPSGIMDIQEGIDWAEANGGDIVIVMGGTFPSFNKKYQEKFVLDCFRAMNDLTQEILADKLRVTRQTILAIEKGKYDPSLELAFKIAEIFDVKIEDIFLYKES